MTTKTAHACCIERSIEGPWLDSMGNRHTVTATYHRHDVNSAKSSCSCGATFGPAYDLDVAEWTGGHLRAVLARPS